MGSHTRRSRLRPDSKHVSCCPCLPGDDIKPVPAFSNEGAYLSRTVPLKLIKYLLLEQYGLTTATKLQSEVTRYQRREYPLLVSELEKRVTPKINSPAWLYIVKLVDPDVVGQLPNYRIV